MPRRDERSIPNDKFTRMLEFAGTFEAAARKTQPFSIEIAHSTVNNHTPVGIIRGTSAEYNAIERFFVAKRPPTCVLRSSSEERNGIVCRDVLIHGLSNKLFPQDERVTIQQVIGHFSFEELEMRSVFGPRRRPTKKRAAFIMDGPSMAWMTYSQQILSSTGEIENEVHDAIIGLEDVPEILAAQPHYVYANQLDRFGGVPEVTQAKLFSLTVEAAEGDSRSIDEFFAYATDIADALISIVGFLSKSPIRWFSATCSDDSVFIERHRRASANRDESLHWDEMVLSSTDIRPFLSKAFSNHRATSMNVRLPLTYYISSQSTRFVEDRFTVLFFAFEKMLSALDSGKPESELLTDSELSALWRVVRPALAGMGKCPEQVRLIQEKRAELRRPSLRHKVARHLSMLSVDLADIGGEDGLQRMIRVRNKLIHDRDEVPLAEVVFETKRLETIVERMLLRMLGWSGEHQTPTSANCAIAAV